MASYKPPGRLGDPDMSLGTDPRTHTKLLPLFKAFKMDTNAPPSQLTVTSSLDEIGLSMAKSHTEFEQFYAFLPNDLPADATEAKLEHSDVTIKGVDGNDVKLYISRLAGTEKQQLPCVVYIHGGGMVIINTINKGHVRWRTDLALAGVVCIAVDFRNAWTEKQHQPFPAGLNDCAAAVKWIASHKSELGISKIVLQGESGGANLSIATSLKANREDWISSIDGVFGCVPYISCAWGWPKEKRLQELPSTVENDGYFVTAASMAVMGHYYTPNDADKTNPLAWPYHATMEDVMGLPPHVLVMDELDPLRDEGIAYYRKLLAAGVSVHGSVNLGVTHGSSLIFRQALPDLHVSTIEQIVAFAKSL